MTGLANDPNTITTPEAAANLPIGQWVIDSDDRKLCLVDTHAGFPQRMWMHRGRTFLAVQAATYPLHLGDFDGPCEHRHGTNECGHCIRCGVVVAEPTPWHFDDESAAVIAMAARNNARILAEREAQKRAEGAS